MIKKAKHPCCKIVEAIAPVKTIFKIIEKVKKMTNVKQSEEDGTKNRGINIQKF